MKQLSLFYVGLLLAGLNASVYAEAMLEHDPGEEVLVNCRQIYTRGVIHHKIDNGYIINFAKHSGPIQCSPYRWDNQFIFHFKSVPEYTLKHKSSSLFGLSQEVTFKVGERVTLQLPRNKKLLGTDEPIDIPVQIVDMSDLGAISVKLLSSEHDVAVTFSQWIGTNYIDLRHDALEQERKLRAH